MNHYERKALKFIERKRKVRYEDLKQKITGPEDPDGVLKSLHSMGYIYAEYYKHRGTFVFITSDGEQALKNERS